MIAVNHGATYRPAGPLLRVLRLDRWVCSTCQGDNLVRRDTSILLRPCRWCGAELLSVLVAAQSAGEMVAEAFRQMGEACRMAGEMLARAFPPKESAG